MRAVGLSDLDVAARALLAQPPCDRAGFATRLIAQAHTADLWRKRFGVACPNGGTGSLYAQACLWPRVPSSKCSASYCSALAEVLDALAAWRARGDNVS